MATVLRFPHRPSAATALRADRPTAEVVILPCIRREPMGTAARVLPDVLEQLQA